MRLGPTLLVSAFVACFLPFVTLAHNVHHPRSGALTAKRAPPKNSIPEVVAQRQHHVHRDLIDLCLNADASAVAPILQLINPLAANIRLCLCVKDLDIFLNSDIGVLLGGLLGGPDGLLAKLKLLINTSPHSVQCTFPTHSHRLCVTGNPCAYECDPPYVKEGDKCVCKYPLTECNGVCAYNPQGCSSAAPHKQLRETSSITSYAAAVAQCKPEQTICGIPGREGTKDFECVDTTTTLDSCGGCVVQHPFSDGPTSVKGVDCGRLPGVVTTNCSNSRCEITQCRSGWHLDAKRNECVKASAGTVRRSIGSRMKKASKRGKNLEVKTVIASELASQLNAYARLVLNLSSASRAVPTALSTSQPVPGSSTPSIDQAYYVNTMITATLYTLRSPTVVALMANINSLVNVNTLARNAFEGCGCIDTLGLYPVYNDLIAVVNAGLGIQNWCHNHSVGVPSNSTNPTTVPNTSGAPITIGLDDVLYALGVASQSSHVDIFGLGSGLTDTTNSLLNGLGLGPKNVRPRSLARSSTTALNPELLRMTKALVDAVVVLKNCDSNLPLPQPSNPARNLPLPQPSNPAQPLSHPTPVKPPADSNLINAILEATGSVLNSHTVSAFVGNVDTLVRVNSIVADALGSCGCVDSLGLAGLLENLTAVIDAALGIQDWCTHNPVGVPNLPSTSVPVYDPTVTPNLSVPSSPSTTSSPLPPNTQDTTVIVDLDLTTLLGSLGLGSTPGGDLLGLGNLLGGILAPVSSVSSGGPATGIAIDTGNLVDSTLLSQIQALVNLTLAIQSGSAALPSAPYNSTGGPLPGSVPLNGNLVTGIVEATLNLLNSGTVGELLHNLQVLSNVNALVQSSLAGCGCIDQLGLAGLVKDVDALLAAVLNLQSWCAGHPVVVPSHPHTSSLPTRTTVSGHAPTATTGAPVPIAGPNSHLLDLVIDLGLGNLASALTLGLASNVNATVDLKDLLNTLVGVVVQIQNHSTSLPPASTTTVALPTVSAPVTPGPLASSLPLTQGVINDLVQAVTVLLNSTTTADLLTSTNTLLNLSNLLDESMNHCGCIDSLGLHALEDDLNALLDALLTLHAWCQYHPGGKSPGGSGPDTIKIDTHDLLAALGLDTVLQVKGNVAGLGLSGLVNPLLHGLGLGGVRRWLMG